MKIASIGMNLPGDHYNHRCKFGISWQINYSTRIGRVVSWLLDLCEAIQRGPQAFRFWRADRLSRKALALRGQTPTVFGAFDRARGNEAARLADIIFDETLSLCIFGNEDAWEHFHSIQERLETLAQMAGATWHRNFQQPNP